MSKVERETDCAKETESGLIAKGEKVGMAAVQVMRKI